MVKAIMGSPGTGKTKQMINLINEKVSQTKGVVVCLAQGQKLNSDLTHSVRLIDTIPYKIQSLQVLQGFITGIYAGNYDICDIFIDNLFKVSGENNISECQNFLDWCGKFGEENGINFIVTISIDQTKVSDNLKKFA